MPELPEVEVTCQRIRPFLEGRVVQELQTTADSYFFVTPPGRLREALVGKRIETLRRLGKYLLARLDSGKDLLLHLGMTGQLFTERARSPRLLSSTGAGTLTPEQQQGFVVDLHTHLRFRFQDDGPEVLFRDVRKFGKVQLVDPGSPNARLDKLGPDALKTSGALLRNASRGRKVAIKTLLLNQSVLAGVGNIYADEALFRAGLRPGRAAGRLTGPDCERLAEAVRTVLLRSIETGGSSISDYVQPDGSDGGYQDERQVYDRQGSACLICGTGIRRKVINARSSHYCPTCQR